MSVVVLLWSVCDEKIECWILYRELRRNVPNLERNNSERRPFVGLGKEGVDGVAVLTSIYRNRIG
jgi:hypothetical protein